jgi:photosynthetic reaction center cytochrome c subunit
MRKALSIALGTAATLALTACELGPKEVTQNGYRGTGMAQAKLTSASADIGEVPAPPYDLPPAGAQTAGEAYENVQVLADISREEFDYTMAAITAWVSPDEGCNYCHNPANMASDEVYTKVVARRMIQMNQKVNAEWSSHVQDTGVTCWTCHRGNPVPENYWTLPQMADGKSMKPGKRGQNTPLAVTSFSSLPKHSFASYLSSDLGEPADIKVGSATLYPTDANTLSTMETERTYAFMMHLSDGLGVNCTHCHNTQSFREWSLSTEQRAQSWHGIRMVRDLNDGYITPLKSVFPANRLGDAGDPFKVNCTTCHQGVNKPMGGAKMAADYPALRSYKEAVQVAEADSAQASAADNSEGAAAE